VAHPQVDAVLLIASSATVSAYRHLSAAPYEPIGDVITPLCDPPSLNERMTCADAMWNPYVVMAKAASALGIVAAVLALALAALFLFAAFSKSSRALYLRNRIVSPPPLPQVCLTHIQVSALLVIPLVLAFAAGCVGLWGRSGSIAAVAAVGGVAPASWFFFVSCAFGLVIPLVCFVLALANPCRRCCARPRCGCSGPITNSLRRRLLGRRRWSNPPLQRRRMAQRWRFRRSCKI
jgi:hypothetical protein